MDSGTKQINKMILSPYKLTKSTIHFTDVHGTQFQFNISLSENYMSLWMRKVGEKEWTSIKTKFLDEVKEKCIASVRRQTPEAEQLIMALMTQVNLEQLDSEQ